MKTYVVEALHNLRIRPAFQKAYQDQEHGLVQECAHSDALQLVSTSHPFPDQSTYVCEPLLEDVEPIAFQDILLQHALVLSILLQKHSLLCSIAILSRSLPCPRDCLPPGEGALEPMLPVVVHRRSKHDHEGKLEEQHAIEDEGLLVTPRLEFLCDNIGAAVNEQCGSAGN